jgi:hypothetical protein
MRPHRMIFPGYVATSTGNPVIARRMAEFDVGLKPSNRQVIDKWTTGRRQGLGPKQGQIGLSFEAVNSILSAPHGHFLATGICKGCHISF